MKAQAIFGLAQELLHEVNGFMGNARPRGKAERLFPVQDLLSGYVALQYGTAGKNEQSIKQCVRAKWGQREVDAVSRHTAYRIADERWKAMRVPRSINRIRSRLSITYPYRHSNMMTPRLHQSHE